MAAGNSGTEYLRIIERRRPRLTKYGPIRKGVPRREIWGTNSKRNCSRKKNLLGSYVVRKEKCEK